MNPATPISIVRLPGGAPQSARLHSTEGALFHLVLSEANDELVPGVVVEIQTPEFAYFGEVRTVDGSAIAVLVEHTLNLAQAKAFREQWQ